MIYYFVPFSLKKDLGEAYNQYMDKLNQDDWAVLIDGDCMWLTPDYGFQIQQLIEQNPDAGIITCLTNRVGNLEQCYTKHISEDPNILNHRRIAQQLQRDKRLVIRETDNVISGMCMIIKKSTWTRIHGAPEGRGLLTIDNHISKRVLNEGMKILVAEGLYLFHFYRLDVGASNRSHLITKSTETNVVQTPPSIVRNRRARLVRR